ncbi:MAG: TIGR03885 family FMN-dependent LLM class oxidoreductase [Dehalococcoidia bacterium]|nr:TIGR03885 family FMN-dependent LLM class oxidoreductase [Dehalococcoidia bacterium]
MKVGYHASHEQFAPGELLGLVREAEAAGFAAAMCSDHLAPFSERQGQSGFAWAWLGAALAATNLGFGTVNAPGQRYHPVIIAQAVATLAEMFPGRFWVALGSGQYVNEHVTGERWPAKPERNERLLECVQVIRALLAGETVSCSGHVRVSEARLWSLPAVPPAIVGAAITPETAAWVASWADALITVYQPEGKLAEVVGAFRGAGGAGKPVYLQAQHAFAPTEELALAGAHDQWRQSVLTSRAMAELRAPAQIDDASATARPEDVAKRVRVSADPAVHAAWLAEYAELGIDTVYVHNVTRYQREFIAAFGRDVLPRFTG